MFDIQPDGRFTTEEKLLYNIWKELEKLNSTKEFIPEVKPKVNHEKPCKYCGEIHDNAGQRMACARKHKKEVISDGK